MPRKPLILISVLACISALLFLCGLVIADNTGPETMELSSPAGKKPARFPHRKHQKTFTCNQCHHVKTDSGMKSPHEEGTEIKKCIACHNKEEMDNPKINSFKLAAHGLCKECHKQNSGAAPTKCSGCHIK